MIYLVIHLYCLGAALTYGIIGYVGETDRDAVLKKATTKAVFAVTWPVSMLVCWLIGVSAR